MGADSLHFTDFKVYYVNTLRTLSYPTCAKEYL